MAITSLPTSNMPPPSKNGIRPRRGSAAVAFVPLTYDSTDSEASARRLIHSIRPEWDAQTSNTLKLVRFTDGITNTLLKAENHLPNLSKAEVDHQSILLRAYGAGTDVLIDRHRETENHELLMRHGLAPELLATFDNGMMYRFVSGSVTKPEDMRRPEISTAIARRLAEWHAVVPCLPGQTDLGCGIGEKVKENDRNGHANNLNGGRSLQDIIDGAAPGKPAPNVWTVIQKWIFALPTETEAQRARQAQLQTEFEWLVTLLSQRPSIGRHSLVFAHADLLSGNVIIMPDSEPPSSASPGTTTSKPGTATEENSGGIAHRRPSVTFIDYEYAVPSPAAFDIANHFAEWGGFDCDHSVLPTVSQRRLFVTAYMDSYLAQFPPTPPPSSPSTTTSNDGSASPAAGVNGSLNAASETEKLLQEVDLFRGVPGFYWGVWALIQATISEIDFDYASYAETRLGEYFAWKAEVEGTRKGEMPIRERRWAEE